MVSNEIAKQIVNTFLNKHKLIIIGNGGSATQASHFANEFLGKYKKDRQPLPAIAFTDPGMITAIGNDYGFEYIFSRPLLALGNEGDLLITLSTSGKSTNVLNAIEIAKRLKLNIIEWPREGKDVGDIQNNQVKLMHSVVAIVERGFE